MHTRKVNHGNIVYKKHLQLNSSISLCALEKPIQHHFYPLILLQDFQHMLSFLDEPLDSSNKDKSSSPLLLGPSFLSNFNITFFDSVSDGPTALVD